MDILIGNESALDYWRTVGPNYLRGYDARQAATRRARRALTSSERPTLSEGNRRPAGCTLPLRTLVGSVDVRTRTPAVLSSFCSVLPERSFVDAGEGFLMSTPEFCFLQMANRLTLARLIMLGYELCGTYVLVDKGPAPRRDAPLTTVAKLRTFIEGTSNARGRKKALRALRYVLDRSASPMESALGMGGGGWLCGGACRTAWAGTDYPNRDLTTTSTCRPASAPWPTGSTVHATFAGPS